MIFAEYASPTPGRAFNSAAEAVLMSMRSPCEGAGEDASGVAALAGAVALGLTGAVFSRRRGRLGEHGKGDCKS